MPNVLKALKEPPEVVPVMRLMREEVYERIRAEILSCVLRPGSQVQEGDLAARYGVSKSPIRDALLRLQEQQLLEVLPRKGYRVKPVSIIEVREMYEMRHILERSCVSRIVEHASDADLLTLDQFRHMPANVSLESWIAHNRQFHTSLADICGNSRLAGITREIIAQFDRLIFVQMEHEQPEAGHFQEFVKEHAAIVDALQRRDKRLVVALVKDHVESSQHMLLKQIGSPAVIP